MGIFDIFTNDVAKDAAKQQIQGINLGLGAATGNINQGIGALNTDYTAALQPFLQNYGQAQGGVQQLGNVLGLNGASGNATALQALQNTPGYQFQQQSQDATVNAAAAASGMNASGNQLLALNKVNQGLADSTYNNYVSQLQPFLGASQNAASGIAGVNTGLGNQTANQYGNLANLNYTAQTGIGNANANATLAQNQANQNIFGAVMGLGSLAMGGLGGMGGLGSSLGSSIMGSVPGAVGPSSVGGAPLSNSLYSSVFSDARLKEDIEPVGELYDGTGVYRYRYKGDPVTRIGVMAQEVELTRPDAIDEIGGFKAVRYDKATDLAASLARFVNDNVEAASQPAGGYAADLSRFLKAA
jgi:hypothetical protein